MTTPIKASIKANVETTLKTITTANGYNQTVDSDAVIGHRPYLPNDAAKFPWLNVWWEEEINSNDQIVSHSVKDAVLMVGLKTNDGDDPEPAMEKLKADVEKALMVDRQRGGYAIDTALVDADPDWRPVTVGVKPTGVAYLTFRIRYRHKVGNPY